jgi:hypothetical protein
MGLHSAQGHNGPMALSPATNLGLRPLAGPRHPGAASVCTSHSRHARPWPERTRWWAYHRLNDDKDPERTEGKWSMDLGLYAATRKSRRRGREGGAQRGRHFCGGAHANGDEAPVRGRRSGRGGRRSGWGGALWRCGAHCRVGGVGEQSERASASEVLVEEDDGGGNPVARLR